MIEPTPGPCTMTRYAEHSDARSLKRRLMQRSSIIGSIVFCETCDGYHVRAHMEVEPELSRVTKILTLIAQGYHSEEIAKILNYSKKRTVDDALHKMRLRFYASSTPHLVSIAISLGIVQPAEFLPRMQEAKSWPHRHTTTTA